MARSAQEERIIQQSFEQIVRKMRNVGSQPNFSFKSENPTPEGGVWFRVHHGASMSSWGEKVTVTVIPHAGGAKVTIHSECGMPTQLIDYGKNAQVVRYLFNYIDAPQQAAPASAQAPAAPAQNAAAPAQNTAKFCSKCGAPVTPEARFCSKCGNPLG